MKAIDPVPVPSQGNEETFSDGGGSDGFIQNDDDTDVDDNDPGALFGEVTHVKRARDENKATSNNNTTVSLSVPIPSKEETSESCWTCAAHEGSNKTGKLRVECTT
jgi:hypothetical protein